MFSLGNSQVGIGLAVTLHDRFTRNARNVSREMDMMKRSATQIARTNMSMARDIGMGMAAAGASTLYFLNNASNWF